MNYTGYVGIIIASSLLLIGSWCFLRYQDNRYEEEEQKKKENLEDKSNETE